MAHCQDISFSKSLSISLVTCLLFVSLPIFSLVVRVDTYSEVEGSFYLDFLFWKFFWTCISQVTMIEVSKHNLSMNKLWYQWSMCNQVHYGDNISIVWIKYCYGRSILITRKEGNTLHTETYTHTQRKYARIWTNLCYFITTPLLFLYYNNVHA